MVHVDDLAELYVRAAELAPAGEIFNASDRSRSTVLELATAAARAAGFTREVRPIPLTEARKKMGDFADALALDQHIATAGSETRRRCISRRGRHGRAREGPGSLITEPQDSGCASNDAKRHVWSDHATSYARLQARSRPLLPRRANCDG
jgi:hypothetical protein